MKKLNQHLLTNHPLLWNTRVIWVLGFNLILHILFFLSGFGSVEAVNFTRYNSLESVGGISMYTFSILCSLLVIIVWLIYYLRNNAFKNFYRIGKWHLATEFGIILLVIFTSIIYFESFNYGVRVKVRSVTGTTRFAEEVNTVNHALAYIPLNRESYFILNNCEGRRKQHQLNFQNPGYPENIVTGLDTSNATIRSALQREDAFTYKNYCDLYLSFSKNDRIDSAELMSSRKNRWIDNHNADSIQLLLKSFLKILNKYGVEYRLNADSLVSTVFSTPLNKVQNLITSSDYEANSYGKEFPNNQFLKDYQVRNVFDFIYECYPTPDHLEDRKNILTVEAYVALCFSILLLCYRRFSRRVFLISIVGTIVWSILIGLLVSGSGGSGSFFAVICLLLFACFFGVAYANLKTRSAKTTSGALFNWHAYLAPFAIMFVQLIIQVYYDDRIIPQGAGPDYVKNNYPFSHWVIEHHWEIILVNLFLVILYIAFVFNQLTRRWHEMPEE